MNLKEEIERRKKNASQFLTRKPEWTNSNNKYFNANHNNYSNLFSFNVEEQIFRLRRKYTPLKKVGEGSFGVVCGAIDDMTQRKVAIKRITPMAGDEWDARHTLREIYMMKLCTNHPNMITLTDLSLNEKDNELYIVMELMDSDLHRIIRSKQSLKEAHVKCIMMQLFAGVQAMHAMGIVHRDLKPGNILVTKACQVKITDFGLARSIGTPTMNNNMNIVEQNSNDMKEAQDDEQQQQLHEEVEMTEYVVTRWYRSPELLLAPHLPYTNAIDLWSIGCIFAEIIRRTPLFPGTSHVEQARHILSVMGTPLNFDFGFELREDADRFVKRQPIYEKRSWDDMLPMKHVSREALNILKSLLEYDPKMRMSADDALRSDWLQGFSKLPYEPVPLDDFLQEKRSMLNDTKFNVIERKDAPLEKLRYMIKDEVNKFEEILPSAIDPSRRRISDSLYRQQQQQQQNNNMNGSPPPNNINNNTTIPPNKSPRTNNDIDNNNNNSNSNVPRRPRDPRPPDHILHQMNKLQLDQLNNKQNSMNNIDNTPSLESDRTIEHIVNPGVPYHGGQNNSNNNNGGHHHHHHHHTTVLSHNDNNNDDDDDDGMDTDDDYNELSTAQNIPIDGSMNYLNNNTNNKKEQPFLPPPSSTLVGGSGMIRNMWSNAFRRHSSLELYKQNQNNQINNNDDSNNNYHHHHHHHHHHHNNKNSSSSSTNSILIDNNKSSHSHSHSHSNSNNVQSLKLPLPNKGHLTRQVSEKVIKPKFQKARRHSNLELQSPQKRSIVQKLSDEKGPQSPYAKPAYKSIFSGFRNRLSSNRSNHHKVMPNNCNINDVNNFNNNDNNHNHHNNNDDNNNPVIVRKATQINNLMLDPVIASQQHEQSKNININSARNVTNNTNNATTNMKLGSDDLLRQTM